MSTLSLSRVWEDSQSSRSMVYPEFQQKPKLPTSHQELKKLFGWVVKRLQETCQVHLPLARFLDFSPDEHHCSFPFYRLNQYLINGQISLVVSAPAKQQCSFLLLFLPVTIPLLSTCNDRDLLCRTGVMEVGTMACSNHPGRVSPLAPCTPPSCFSCLLHMLRCTTRKIKQMVEKSSQRGGSVVLSVTTSLTSQTPACLCASPDGNGCTLHLIM